MLAWSFTLGVATACLVEERHRPKFPSWAQRARDAAVKVRGEMLLGEATWVREMKALATHVRAMTARERWDDEEIEAEFAQWLSPAP